MVDVAVPVPSFEVAILAQPPHIDLPTDQPPQRAPSPQAPALPARAATLPEATTDAPAIIVREPVASAGDITQFARAVAVALGKSRPRGIGRSGRVEIEFTIANGRASLDRSRIARSSGSTRLDDLAKAAVDRAAFPEPPQGMTAMQRTFRVPFNFD